MEGTTEKRQPELTKIRSFEGLFVFREALALTNEVYRLTREGAFARDYGLVDQMRRSAVSILSNIAEGFERETTAEFIRAVCREGVLWGTPRAVARSAWAKIHHTTQIRRTFDKVP